MAKEGGVIAGLDMGSAQVSCVIGRRDPVNGQIEVLSGARAACPGGLKGGVVINIKETSSAIERIIGEAETAANAGMAQVLIVGVRGEHLETFNNHGVFNIARTDKEITAEDVQKVIDNAQAVHLSSDKEIIHVIPQSFTLDRQTGVPNPVGMEGAILEVDVHIVTASRSHLNNIYKTVNDAGFQIMDRGYGLLAAGKVVVTQEERELGCLLVDIGGQTTDIAVYFDGSIHYTARLSIGADAITRDIAYRLRTSLSQAQIIKEKHGVALTSMLDGHPDEQITYTAMDGRTSRPVGRRLLVETIEPRVEELFDLVREKLQNSGYADRVVPGGAILTGGGALLGGIQQASERVLELAARTGLPQGVVGNSEVIGHPSFATAIGLLTGNESPVGSAGERIRFVRGASGGSLMGRVRGWFDEVF